MTDDVRTLVLGVVAALACLAAGWFARSAVTRRALRRKQAFFGMPDNSECLLVLSREPGGDLSVHRNDMFALLELAALMKECGALARLVQHDTAQQGFGERTEFCLGDPAHNRRTAAHLSSLLPGVRMEAPSGTDPARGTFRIGSESYPLEAGTAEHVLLARLTAGQGARPVFLLCGQRSITHQAAARYLARHHERLYRRHGDRSFVLLLKVVNSRAYGADVADLVADVTRAAHTAVPAPATAPPAHPLPGT